MIGMPKFSQIYHPPHPGSISIFGNFRPPIRTRARNPTLVRHPGWPSDAPAKLDLTFLDPPYWKQAAGRYSSEPNEMAEMDLPAFYAAWAKVVQTVLKHAKRAAYIISPTQNDDGSVVDHATDMLTAFIGAKWHVERRIIVPFTTGQATGQQVTWARDNRRMLKLYRDLVVLGR
jgi:hypothetical protein